MGKRLSEFDTLAPAHDARQGSGYGRAGKPTGAGTTWKSASEFPYVDIADDEDEDELEAPWDDPENADEFMTKMPASYYSTHDPYGKRRARLDRRSFASSNALAGLGEATAKGMVPFPRMYSNRHRGSTGGGMAPETTVTGPGSYGGKGSKKGWWGRPPPRPNDAIETINTKEELRDLTDDERALTKAQTMHDELTAEYALLFDDESGSLDEE